MVFTHELCYLASSRGVAKGALGVCSNDEGQIGGVAIADTYPIVPLESLADGLGRQPGRLVVANGLVVGLGHTSALADALNQDHHVHNDGVEAIVVSGQAKFFQS